MSELQRRQISIRESLYHKAQELMRLRDFDDFSGFLSQLIREEHERRHGPATLGRDELRESPSKAKAAPGKTVGRVTYGRKGKPRAKDIQSKLKSSAAN